MKAVPLIILFPVLIHLDSGPRMPRLKCQTKIDSLTKRIVYISADINPINDGGQVALQRKLTQLSLSEKDLAAGYNGNFVVAFIIDTSGEVIGERVLKDETNRIGRDLLKIIKGLKWTPAQCDGRKVPFLVKLPIILDPENSG